MNSVLPSIAILHDWYTTFAGSEKVIQQLLQLFPQSDLFSLVDFMPQGERAFLSGKPVRTTFLQRAPFARRHYRSYLPLMPLAIEQLDLSAYGLIFSNCHAVCKGVVTSPDQLHISYIHSPMRYAWDLEKDYLPGSGLRSALGRLVMHQIRLWDFSAAQRPDKLLANSNFIARRIQKFYRRPSSVLYPPVDTDFYTPGAARQDYYLAASRFVPYKRMDLIIQAFRSMPDKTLVLIGDGPEARHLVRDLPSNIRWLGYQPDDALRTHLRACRAFIFAAREDFGILPVEAQACGAPVIAFGKGGVAETVLGPESARPSGVFFPLQTVEAIQTAVSEFEKTAALFSPENCRSSAERFSNQRFRQECGKIVACALEDFSGASGDPQG